MTRNRSWLVAVAVAVCLACGGIPLPGRGGAEAPADGPTAGADLAAPVAADSGGEGAAPEPAPAPAPAPEPASAPAPAPEPAPAAPKPSAPAAPSEPVAPAPDDEEEPAPKVVTGPKGAVKVKGPGRVVLFNQETGRFPVPGDVPVGSYVIRVKFGDKPVVATGRVKVTPVGVTIECNEDMGVCRGQ